MKQSYGFGWRDYVRGVTTTFDIGDNLAFRDKIDAELAALDTKWSSRIDPAYTLDPKKVTADKTLPNVIVVAADGDGHIVRYYEAGETAAYFGSLPARRADNGLYDPSAESRQVASTGKMLLAIASPTRGATRPRASTPIRRLRLRASTPAPRDRAGKAAKPLVAFACSLNAPLINRGARTRTSADQAADRRLRLRDAARCGIGRHAAVDRRRAGPDRRRAPARAIHVERHSGVADRARNEAGPAADADQGLRLHAERPRTAAASPPKRGPRSFRNR